MTKPPPTDLESMVEIIGNERKERALALQSITNEDLVKELESIVASIDVYKTALQAGDQNAPFYLENARRKLLQLMGIT